MPKACSAGTADDPNRGSCRRLIRGTQRAASRAGGLRRRWLGFGDSNIGDVGARCIGIDMSNRHVEPMCRTDISNRFVELASRIPSAPTGSGRAAISNSIPVPASLPACVAPAEPPFSAATQQTSKNHLQMIIILI